METHTKKRGMMSFVREMLLPRRQGRRFVLINTGITLLTLAAAFAVSAMLITLGESYMAVPLVFAVAVLMTAWRTDGYFYSLIAALVSVFGINFCFTYPYFEFNFLLAGYPVTFAAMFMITMVVGMLTDQVKRQSRIRHEAERAKMKANLLRSVSHDLRTPLTSIIGASSAVLENYERLSDAEKKELISHVRGEARWLVQMVENILSITRIGDGGVSLARQEEAAEEIAAEAVQKFRSRFSMPVHVQVPGELLMVPMDATLIEQVLINLMENVVAHADGATQIRLIVRKERDEAVFSVEDDGAGIDSQVLPRLFEEIMPHADGLRPDGRRNMGIGLTACMSIVREHGGQMRAENLPQGGARFEFTLPIGGDYAGESEDHDH